MGRIPPFCAGEPKGAAAFMRRASWPDLPPSMIYRPLFCKNIFAYPLDGAFDNLLPCEMAFSEKISIGGKRFRNRIEKMKHIAVIVLCDKGILPAHANAFGHLDRSKVIRFYDGIYFIPLQILKSIFFAPHSSFPCIAAVPKVFFQQIADFKHLCIFAGLHGKPRLPDHFIGAF